MAAGDHVFVRRPGYTHHGVEVNDGMVVHFSGTPGSKRGASIRREPLETFSKDATVQVTDYGERFDPAEVVERAESKLGQSGYNLYGNNCEHFARWCVTGDHKSRQVNGFKATGAVGGSTATAAGGVGVVSAAGVTTGLSGPGIMSGLAASGAVVGSGAVGGLVVLGLVPGVTSALVMNVALRDDKALPSSERSARRVGRKASVAGVAGGSMAGVAAVSSAGSVAGLSAAGISSGLATIGGTIGGGMAAGSFVVIAVPAVAAAGVGYGAYRLTRFVAAHPPSGSPQVSKAATRLRRSVAGSEVAKRLRIKVTDSELTHRLRDSAAEVPRRMTELRSRRHADPDSASANGTDAGGNGGRH